MTIARLPRVHAPAEAVALNDGNKRPATCTHCSQPIFVLTHDDRSRRATTATAAASARRDVTTRLAAVCKMTASVAVTATTRTTRTTVAALILLVLAFVCPRPAVGQLQGKYNGPYPDICPRYDFISIFIVLRNASKPCHGVFVTGKEI